MSNEDKNIRHSHVQMKLRSPQPVTVYIVRMSHHTLPWLHSDGWAISDLHGVSYHGSRSTVHKEWAEDNVNGYELQEDHFPNTHESETSEVWQKTFPAGTIELRGNDGGDGSYLIFVANPLNPPTPPLTTPAPTEPAGRPGAAEYIGCFIDDGSRDMGAMVGSGGNAATNTFELCRARCGASTYMSLQAGGECFCANSYGTRPQYTQVADSNCGARNEPCFSTSFNCGGTWRQAIYQIN